MGLLHSKGRRLELGIFVLIRVYDSGFRGYSAVRGFRVVRGSRRFGRFRGLRE